MYRLNADQQRVVADIAAIADRHAAPHAARVDRDATFPGDSIAGLGDAGFLGLTIAARFGGMGHGLRVAAAALDEMARRCPSTAMVYLMHLCGVACYAGAPENTSPYLEAAAGGRHLSTLAFSESGSRSHFWAPVSQAAQSNGHVQVNARKSFVTSAARADGYVVSTRDVAASQPLASTLYLVLRGDAGLRVAGEWDGLGMRGNASAPMELASVQLADDRRLTAPGKGLDAMLGVVLPLFQVGVGAIAIGIAEAAVEATRRHLTSARFDHLNSSLAELPTLRARLAQMRVQTDCARAHLTAVLDSLETPGPLTQLLVLEAKAVATEAAVSVTDLAMRACGGAALGKPLGLERLFRDARAPIVMAPTTDQAYEFIGRALCGLEVF